MALESLRILSILLGRTDSELGQLWLMEERRRNPAHRLTASACRAAFSPHLPCILLQIRTPPNMSHVSLPLEMVLAIADRLKYTDYEGFLTYLEFRKTGHQLHTLLKLPTYAELFAHKDVFLPENILPCSNCRKLRPASTHFFNGLRTDGIGSSI